MTFSTVVRVYIGLKTRHVKPVEPPAQIARGCGHQWETNIGGFPLASFSISPICVWYPRTLSLWFPFGVSILVSSLGVYDIAQMGPIAFPMGGQRNHYLECAPQIRSLHSSDELDSQGKLVNDLKTIIPLTF